jgi:hypothetical protein
VGLFSRRTRHKVVIKKKRPKGTQLHLMDVVVRKTAESPNKKVFGSKFAEDFIVNRTALCGRIFLN